jgi:hypothetical protein
MLKGLRKIDPQIAHFKEQEKRVAEQKQLV